MASFGQGILIPALPFSTIVMGWVFPLSTSSPAFNSQEYYNRIMYRDVMYPYYGNIDPHRISSLGGGDYYCRFNDDSIRDRANSPWVQHEETLILDGHGESNVATPRHGDLSMEVMIAKNLKTKSCRKVLAKDKDGVPKICVVCQEDLCHEEEEEIEVLDCRHEYHACCIKNWLVRKNVCPLYNATGVKVD